MSLNWTILGDLHWYGQSTLKCIGADIIKEQIITLQTLKDAMDRRSSTACILGLIMMAFSILGILSNSISISIFTHDSMRCVPVNVLLAGLSCIDLFLSVFILPVFVMPALSVYYKWQVMDCIQPYVTLILYPLTLMTQSASVWVFVVITCERWSAVCRPLQARRYSSVSNAKRAFIVVCVSAVLYNSIRYGEFQLVKYQRQQRDAHEAPMFVYDCDPRPGNGPRVSLESIEELLGPSTLASGSWPGPANASPKSTWSFLDDLDSVNDPLDFTLNSSDHLEKDHCCDDFGRGKIPDLRLDTSIGSKSANAGTTEPDSMNKLSEGLELAPRLRDDPAYMFFYYFGLYLLTHFALPFSILVIVNVHVVRTILTTRTQRRLLTRHERREHRIALMMGVVVVAFLVCNTIPFAMNLLEAYDRSYFNRPETLYTAHLVNDIGNLLVVVHSSTTAFIYHAFSERYRRRCQAHLCFKKSKKPSVLSHRSYLSFRYSIHEDTLAEQDVAHLYALANKHTRFSSTRRTRNGHAETEVFLPDGDALSGVERTTII